eukprot:c26557_g1_i1 orf=108-281(-)
MSRCHICQIIECISLESSKNDPIHVKICHLLPSAKSTFSFPSFNASPSTLLKATQST